LLLLLLLLLIGEYVHAASITIDGLSRIIKDIVII